MFIGSLRLELRLAACHTLKEKRSIVKSVIARLRNEFNVAVAEVAAQDRWQTAVLGIVCVSGDQRYAQQQLQAVMEWIERNRPDVDIVDREIELL